MYYSEEYIIKKIKQKLPDIKINKIHKNNKEIYQLDYKNHKGEIDLETFKNKFTTNKTKESDNSLENYLNIITKNFLLQENFKIENIPKEQFLKKIYPVMRAKTFLKDKADNFLTKEHTHESKIFYALDLKDSYKLIEKKSLEVLNLQEEVVKKEAIENLKKLPLKYNKEEIKGNTFYFLNAKDGYDGSRILDEEILKYFFKKIQKDFYIGLPHQETLIIADIKNKIGLQILQKIMVKFYTEGLLPVTTITFKYDGEKLESFFIYL